MDAGTARTASGRGPAGQRGRTRIDIARAVLRDAIERAAERGTGGNPEMTDLHQITLTVTDATTLSRWSPGGCSWTSCGTTSD